MILRVGLEFVGELEGEGAIGGTTRRPARRPPPRQARPLRRRIRSRSTSPSRTARCLPTATKVSVKVGQKIVLTVTSDEAEEIHAHTADADGYALDVPAGKKVTGSLTLSSPGSYVVEAHHLEKTIAILNAR